MFKPRFDFAFLFTAALTLVSGGLCYYLKGEAGVLRALAFVADLVIQILPFLIVAILLAGFVYALVPRDLVARWLGREAGLKGIVLASVAGALTPGGPWVSFSLVLTLSAAGADIGALVAYVTGWSVIAIHRVIIWEIPMMGPDLTFMRLAASLFLPIIAGLIARQLPYRRPNDKESG